MIPNTRNCMVFKHEQFSCSHICTHKDCNFDQRWLCVECIKNNIHLHGQNTQSHLLDQEDFKSYFKQIDFKQLSEQENNISQCLRALHKIREQINELDCYLQLCLKESGNKILRDLQYQIDHQFFLINNEQISQIVKLNQNPNLTIDQNKVDESINQLILLSQQLAQMNGKQEQIIEQQNQLNSQPQQNQKKFIQQQPKKLNQQDQQVLQIQYEQQVLQIQQVQQQVQQAQKQQVQQQTLFAQVDKKLQHKFFYEEFKKFSENNYIIAPRISQNEKYLAYGLNDKIIIYNLEQQITKEMKFDGSISACCFSRDSTLLYIGCGDGYFYCIQFDTNMSHRYKQKLHKDSISDIYQLENDQVISSSDKKIIISDIKVQKKLYKLDASEGLYFYGMDIKNFNIIVIGLCGSSDRSINFYNQKLQLLFQVNDVTQDSINQIRFLGDNQIIIQYESGTLQLQQIDLNKKTGKYRRKIKDKNKIYNIGVSQTKNQILTICDQYFVIFDSNFQNPQIFQHTQGYDVRFNNVRQLESMNYVIIEGSNIITVMKRIEMI